MRTFLVSLGATIAINTTMFFYWQIQSRTLYLQTRDEICTSAAELGITTAVKCAIEEGVSFEHVPLENITRRSQKDIERLIPSIKWNWQRRQQVAVQ